MRLALLCSILGTCCRLLADAMYQGDYRSVKDYPYMAQLYYEYEGGSVTFCGAAILSEYWVISAAHCVGYQEILKSQVRLGSSTTLENGVLIDVDKYFVHGDYYPDFSFDNDVALIKLKAPIEYNEYQQPIQITRELPRVADKITVLGFGDHHYQVQGKSLRGAETSIIEDSVCFESYESKYTENMICTSIKQVDLCYGDSGGPAVHNGKLIGVIAQGCEYTKPNILTKVANYYDWVLRITGIKYADQKSSTANR